MQIDQTKFMNLLIEKTNNKLNQANNQIIILEAQLQLAIELNKSLQDELDKLKKKKEKTTIVTGKQIGRAHV